MTMTFWTASTTTFTLWDAQGNRLAEVSAPYGQSISLLRAHPFYRRVTINGITEDIEHRRTDDVIYVNRDPKITMALNAIVAKIEACVDAAGHWNYDFNRCDQRTRPAGEGAVNRVSDSLDRPRGLVLQVGIPVFVLLWIVATIYMSGRIWIAFRDKAKRRQ